jgi:hypothetical protein
MDYDLEQAGGMPSKLAKYLARLSGADQETFDLFRDTVKRATTDHALLPDAHPGNVLYDGKELRPIDFHDASDYSTKRFWRDVPQAQRDAAIERYLAGVSLDEMQQSIASRSRIPGEAKTQAIELLKALQHKLKQAARHVPSVIPDAMAAATAISKSKKDKTNPMIKFMQGMMGIPIVQPTGNPGEVYNNETGQRYKPVY